MRRKSEGGTRLVGYVAEMDPNLVAADLAKIGPADFTNAYEEYAVGTWKSVMLANESGDAARGVSVEYDGAARPTDVGVQFGYVRSLMESSFDLSRLKSARIFVIEAKGAIVPHRDYLEFRRGFTRVHLVLRTQPTAYNADEDRLFHFRDGEVWFVDGRRVHSAGILTDEPRYHLVLDFDPDCAAEDVVSPRVRRAAGSRTPTEVPRPRLDREELAAILSTARLLDERTLTAFVQWLSKVHVVRRVEAGAMYDWLVRMAGSRRDRRLQDVVATMKKKFVG